MTVQAGGYEKLTHTTKDFYNMIGSSNTIDLVDFDTSQALGYLLHKSDHDVGFFGKYSYDEHFHL